jgi:ABC-type amino acid transport substrate-binding protein
MVNFLEMRMRQLIQLVTFCVSAIAVSTTSIAASAEQLKLASNENLAEQVIAARLLTDIYRRSHLEANIIPLPPTRANMSALNGATDGEVARIDAYAIKNPGLIQIRPSYYFLTTVAFSKAPITVRSKDDLKKYKIGVIRGVAHSNKATEGMSNIVYANDARSLFLMLKAGRFDIAIDTGTNGNYLIKKMNLEDIHAVGELARLELFHILSPNKKHLVAPISTTIRQLKSSGELDLLIKRYEQEFLQSGEHLK